MDFSLTDDQQALYKEVSEFAQKELNSGVIERDREQTFPRDLWRRCGQAGLLAFPVPKEYGGRGLDCFSTVRAFEALGYGSHDGGVVFSVGAHLFSCLVPIWKHGSEEQKQRYLPGLCNGTLIGANASSEPNAGSDIFSMITRADRDGEGYRINGKKVFVTNGPVADVLVVCVVTDFEKKSHGGISAFLVEKGTSGYKAGPNLEKMGLRTSPIGEVMFDNVPVTAGTLLGKLGAGSVIFAQFMEWERIGLSAAHIGTMQQLLETAIHRARTRQQFGQSIGKFQAIAHRIANMNVQLEAARLLTYRAAWLLDHAKNVSLEASMAKLFVGESFIQTALDTVHILGGYGYLTEYEVERALRDSVASTIYSGTSEIQSNIVARWLGL
jgi:alkylation response protein AidB-like acyl-CoA dehydrogenase